MEEEFDLVECQDCAGMVDDPQYTCTTCWCEGGNGMLKVCRPTPRAADLLICPACQGVGGDCEYCVDGFLAPNASR